MRCQLVIVNNMFKGVDGVRAAAISTPTVDVLVCEFLDADGSTYRSFALGELVGRLHELPPQAAFGPARCPSAPTTAGTSTGSTPPSCSPSSSPARRPTPGADRRQYGTCTNSARGPRPSDTAHEQ